MKSLCLTQLPGKDSPLRGTESLSAQGVAFTSAGYYAGRLLSPWRLLSLAKQLVLTG